MNFDDTKMHGTTIKT